MDSPHLSRAIVEELGRGLRRRRRSSGADVTDGRPGWDRTALASGRAPRVGPGGGADVAARAGRASRWPRRRVRAVSSRCAWSPRRGSATCKGSWASTGCVRPYWHCAPCHQGLAPLDAVLGVGPGALSPGLSRVACRLGIEEAFAPAAEILAETLRVDVPEEAVRRITEGIGAVAEAEQQAAMAAAQAAQEPPPADEAPAQLVVAVDGVMVHTDGDWHEMKVGVVAPLGPGDLDRPGQRPGVPDAGRAECLRRAGAGRRPSGGGCTAKRGGGAGRRARALVVVLGDGADWIWHAAARFLHVGGASHWSRLSISTTRGSIYGRSPMRSMARAARPPRRGSGRSNAAWWRRASSPCSRRWRPAGAAQRRRDRGSAEGAGLLYGAGGPDGLSDLYRPQLPIGSGVVESANKTLITAREKGAGMRWRGPGAQAVASLRAVHRSGRWDAFWRTQPQRRRPAVFPRRPRPGPPHRHRAAGRLAPQWWGGPWASSILDRCRQGALFFRAIPPEMASVRSTPLVLHS